MLRICLACWDTPPPTTSHLYADFKRAITRYLRARQVVVPVLSSSKCRERDAKAASAYVPPKEQPECIVGGVRSFDGFFIPADMTFLLRL